MPSVFLKTKVGDEVKDVEYVLSVGCGVKVPIPGQRLTTSLEIESIDEEKGTLIGTNPQYRMEVPFNVIREVYSSEKINEILIVNNALGKKK